MIHGNGISLDDIYRLIIMTRHIGGSLEKKRREAEMSDILFLTKINTDTGRQNYGTLFIIIIAISVNK